MDSIGRILFLVFSSLILASCQNTPCRDIKNQKIENAAAGASSSTSGINSASGASLLKVKVYKADGSLQCNMGKKTSLDEMKKDLKTIKVLSQSNQNDGLMRIQVCGAPTGNSNVYEINESDLALALKLGFKQWTNN